MSHANAAAPSIPTCSLCNKQGLPILPVRYAIARADLGNAPVLPPSFGEGVIDIALPESIATYTLRTLRPGYLYVYDEHRSEWSAYVVNSQSYLWEYDIHAKAPPAIKEQVFSAQCRGKSDPYIARCFTVRSPTRATKIWMAYSDAPWTAAVLAEHASDEYRQAHMQCMDIAAWRENNSQTHVVPWDALTRIAEFAANGASLHRETREHVKKFLPPPFDGSPEDITGYHKDAKKALSTLSPTIQNLLAGAVGEAHTQGRVISAAWAHSPQPMSIARHEIEGMLAWGNRAAAPLRPAIVGLTDPVGIAMELNLLALQLGVEFLERPEWKWQFETVSAIDAIHNAVLNGAVIEGNQDKIKETAIFRPFIPHAAIRNAGSTEAMNQHLEQAGLLSVEEKEKIDQHIWPKYQAELNQAAWSAFKDSYPDDLRKLDQDTIAPLDRAYVAWLRSDAFVKHFTHNFDPANPNNGAIYQRIVHDCIVHASGRRGAGAYFKECLASDPAQPTQVILRALIFNQQQLASAWTGAAVSMGTAVDASWREVGEKLYEAIKDAFIQSSLGEDIRGPLANLCKLLYQLGGPISNRLGEALNEVADMAVAKLPERRMLTLMMGILQADQPELELLDVRSAQSPRQAAKALARAVAEASGDGAQNLYRSAETLIRDDAKPLGHIARGLFLIDKRQLAAMKGESAVARLASVRAESFEELFAHSTRKMFNAEVKGGTIGVLFTAAAVIASYGDLVKSDDKTIKSMKFGASVASFLGESFETTGRLLEKAPWAESYLQKLITSMGVRFDLTAAKLVGLGKWLGLVGGVASGALDIYEGVEDFEIAPTYGTGMIALGAGGIGSAAIAASSSASLTGVGFALCVLIAAGTYCVQRYEPNDIQKWMARCKFGKLHQDDRYRYMSDQKDALAKLAKG